MRRGDLRTPDVTTKAYTGGIAFNSSPAASADRTLTVDLQNGSRTLDISADTTLSGSPYTPGGTDVAVSDGGTGRSSHTEYAVLCGGTTATGAQQSIASVGTAGQVLTSNGAGALPTMQAPLGTAYILLRDEKSAGTQGGSSTAGSWQTRTINTESIDTDSLCSLSANQFTLTAGTYEIDVSAQFHAVNCARLRLQNITDGTTISLGNTCWFNYNTSVSGHCHLNYRFTVAASKALEIQYYCDSSVATNGLGAGSNFGVTEIYLEAVLHKVG